MTVPLLVLAVLAVVVGFLGTPAWPWFQSYLEGGKAGFDLAKLLDEHQLPVMLLSTGLVVTAMVLSGWIYSRAANRSPRATDPMETFQPALFTCLRRKFYVDEFYDATVVRLTAAFAKLSDWLDRAFWGGLIRGLCQAALAISRWNRSVDETVVNGGFDAGTESVRGSGAWLSRLQNGQVQRYLRIIGLAFCGLLIILLWGSR
jgi:NADH-quinone oxidoreductase subunit L